MEVLFREAESIEGSIQTENKEWSSMKISIDNNNRSTNIHIKYKLEQEPPENNGNGQFHTKRNLINNLNIKLQTKK